MLDDKQIRAARALLNWTQEALADASGVARATIKNIENGTTRARLETGQALQTTLEAAGVEFLPGSGVRMRDDTITVLKGEDANKQLLEDVYATLGVTGGEYLVAHLDEGNAIKSVGRDFLQDHIEKRQRANITTRSLVKEGDVNLIPPFDSYRILPKQYVSPYPFCIYGDKLALVSLEPSPMCVIIKDKRFAQSARGLFNFAWDRTQMPQYKTERA